MLQPSMQDADLTRGVHAKSVSSADQVVILSQVGAFGDPGRDPRGWSVSVAFAAVVPSKDASTKAGVCLPACLLEAQLQPAALLARVHVERLHDGPAGKHLLLTRQSVSPGSMTSKTWHDASYHDTS